VQLVQELPGPAPLAVDGVAECRRRSRSDTVAQRDGFATIVARTGAERHVVHPRRLRKSEHERQRQTGPRWSRWPSLRQNRRPTAGPRRRSRCCSSISSRSACCWLVKSQDEPPPRPQREATGHCNACGTHRSGACRARSAAQASVTQTLPEQQYAAPPPRWPPPRHHRSTRSAIRSSRRCRRTRRQWNTKQRQPRQHRTGRQPSRHPARRIVVYQSVPDASGRRATSRQEVLHDHLRKRNEMTPAAPCGDA